MMRILAFFVGDYILHSQTWEHCVNFFKFDNPCIIQCMHGFYTDNNVGMTRLAFLDNSQRVRAKMRKNDGWSLKARAGLFSVGTSRTGHLLSCTCVRVPFSDVWSGIFQTFIIYIFHSAMIALRLCFLTICLPRLASESENNENACANNLVQRDLKVLSIPWAGCIKLLTTV